tara:strand:+ start:15 stop:263 length:249 start_codon:yes stop_codon:yes gene_type:complete
MWIFGFFLKLVGLQKTSRTPLMDAQLALRLFEMIRIGQANLAEAELRKLRSNAGTGPLGISQAAWILLYVMAKFWEKRRWKS